MTNRKMDEATRLIEEFLMDHPNPNDGDWKRLIESKPQHACAIADAALTRGGLNGDAGADMELPVNKQLYDATISRVLSLVHQTSSPALADAQQKIATILGPKVRKIAAEIGIGPYAQLLNGVLWGRTLAPRRVLAALGERLEVSLVALAEVFRRNFAQSEVPAFKATAGQPQVGATPKTWEEAVKAMKLSADETRRLLTLADEG